MCGKKQRKDLTGNMDSKFSIYLIDGWLMFKEDEFLYFPVVGFHHSIMQ